ncbi:MAG: hypothetical protein FWG68_09490, partial [Defluviitaleaceae bacterium]|nr:hypothetical protein [Defluviitaleaceae bacterium]
RPYGDAYCRGDRPRSPVFPFRFSLSVRRRVGRPFTIGVFNSFFQPQLSAAYFHNPQKPP